MPTWIYDTRWTSAQYGAVVAALASQRVVEKQPVCPPGLWHFLGNWKFNLIQNHFCQIGNGENQTQAGLINFKPSGSLFTISFAIFSFSLPFCFSFFFYKLRCFLGEISVGLWPLRWTYRIFPVLRGKGNLQLRHIESVLVIVTLEQPSVFFPCPCKVISSLQDLGQVIWEGGGFSRKEAKTVIHLNKEGGMQIGHNIDPRKARHTNKHKQAQKKCKWELPRTLKFLRVFILWQYG